MLKLENISLPIGFNDNDVLNFISKNLKIDKKIIKSWEFLKLSIDARHKNNIKYVASVAFSLDPNTENKFKNLAFELNREGLIYERKHTTLPPIIVGFGPSGMFSALALARMGLNPIVLEQGSSIEKRSIDVKKFWEEGKLNKYSNVQFGEGGAGTFSDGKLNSNTSNDITKKIIFELYKFGAPKEILYLSKPHIGSDKLQQVVKNLRQEIINLGGKVLFDCKMTDISIKNSQINGVFYKNVITGEEKFLNTNHLLLCLGHSARDSFEMLLKHNLNISQKPFAMGVRIEQKQSMINSAQFGKDYDKRLPNADYKLVVHLPNGRSVFTFCMCPGGYVVSSASDDNQIVTNGMSNFARNGENANSALLVNVSPQDFGSTHPLAGIYFQEKYERLAFQLGGGNFTAPAQSVAEFLGKNKTNTLSSTYLPKIKLCDISKCLPDFVSESLRKALPLFNDKLKGFASDENLLIALESRSSCPITIVRDQTMQSNIKGIYPVGEGAGYSGGIITSAQDGVKVANAIYSSLN